MCRQEESWKAYGARTTQHRELEWCHQVNLSERTFWAKKTGVQEVPKTTQHQPIYYVTDSFEDAKQKMIDLLQQSPDPLELDTIRLRRASSCWTKRQIQKLITLFNKRDQNPHWRLREVLGFINSARSELYWTFEKFCSHWWVPQNKCCGFGLFYQIRILKSKLWQNHQKIQINFSTFCLF